MDSNGSAFTSKCAPLSRAQNALKGTVPVWLAGVLVVLLLIIAGIGYRVMAAVVQTARNTPIELPVPLSAVPTCIGGWVGDELPVPTVTKAYMETYFADDFISRRYENTTKGLWADVYAVYCSANPAGIVGHQPRICFPGHGWIWDQTVPSEITSQSGRLIKCLVHCFHKPAPAYQQIFVLNFYVLNGQVTRRESDFANFLGRRPNLAGDPARYVAQIQISSILEHAARAAARDMADTVLSFLPDRDGHVEASNLPDGLTRVEGMVEGDQRGGE